MKRRIFSLLIALCLIVGLLPPVAVPHAHAEEAAKTAKIGILGIDYTLTEGMTPKYWLRTEYDLYDAEGNFLGKGGHRGISCDAEDDWAIMWEWPTGGVPTITLHKAYLRKTVNGVKVFKKDDKGALTSAGTAYDAIAVPTAARTGIKVILDGESFFDGDAFIRGHYSGNVNQRFTDITIEGKNSGKLNAYLIGKELVTVSKNDTVSTRLTIKDVTMDVSAAMTASESGVISGTSLPIEIENSDIKIENRSSTSSPAISATGTKSSLTVKNSTLRVNGGNANTNAAILVNGNITFENSNVTAQAVAGSATGVHADGGTVTVNGGTLTAKGLWSTHSYGIEAKAIELQAGEMWLYGYSGAMRVKPTLPDSTTGTCGNTATYEDGNYFEITDAYKKEYVHLTVPTAGCNHDNVTAHAAKPATCKEAGNIAYWHCADCNKYFSDAALETEIEENSWVQPKTDAHTYGEQTDCTVEVKCSVCDEVMISAGSHTGGEATCEKLAECETCGKEYGKLAEHTYDKQTDCTVEVKCSVCDEVMIPAGSHTGGEATCEKLAECETCGKEYGKLADHKYTNYVSDKNATYNEDGTKTAFCDYDCGAKHTVTDEGSMLQGAVAEANGVKYGTLSEAIAAGGNVKLLADATADFLIKVVKDQEMTLDLNGYTITAEAGRYYIISVEVGGKLTINGEGGIINNNVGGYAIVNKGELIVNGGNIVGDYALYNGDFGLAAKATLNGGTFSANEGAFYSVANASEMIVDGATLNDWVNTASKFTVESGKIENLYVGVADKAVVVGIATAINGGEVEALYVEDIAKNPVTKGENAIVEAPEDYKWVDGALTAKNYVAQIGDAKYETLAEAVAEADDEDIIVLQASVKGSGIVIDKSITIDFNGKTYTFNSPAVGSSGTQTLGFQILENNTVVLKNGKLDVAEEAKTAFAMMIQNYANLTVDKMELDGKYLDRHEIKDYNYSYVLSNNSGKVVIADTTITANDSGDGYAFDSCKYRTYAVPNVEVKGDSVINGIIEVTGGNLTINGGEFTGNGSNGLIRVDSGNVTINAGSFQATLGADKYSMAVWAKGGETTIKGGTFKNATDGSERGTDLIYASIKGKITIEGGVFEAATPAWTLNQKDGERNTTSITVKGGYFKDFDPANNNAEGKGTNFLADKTKHTKCVDNVYSICTGTVGTALVKGETTHWNTCSGCDAKFNETAHVYKNYTSNNDAAINKNATETGTCACGATDTREIAGTALKAVAKVGETEYATLQAAIDEADPGATVTLMDDITISAYINITKSITLDLGKNTITRVDGTGLYINNAEAEVVIKNGTINASSNAIFVDAAKKVEIIDCTAICPTEDYKMAAIIVYGGEVVINNTNVTAYGPAVWALDNSKVTIWSGNIVGGNHAAYASGNASIVIEGGKFSVSVAERYHYVVNKLDADRENASIVVKGGEFVNFDPANNNAEGKGTNFLADKTQHTKCVDNVYSICEHTSETTDIDEVPATCTVDGSKTTVVTCDTCDKELSRTVEPIKAAGHTAAEAVKEHEVPATCGTAGSYESVVYCSVCTTELSRTPVTVDATNDHSYDDGVVTVEPGLNNEGVKTFTCATCGNTYTQTIAPTNGNAVAKIGTTYYESLIAAYEAAVDGDEITLLKTVTVGEGLVIKKSITIDFNGKTYYVSTPVGSKSTVSNGFQILEEAGEVTLKNGTLRARDDKADLFYILIQNYADLTITDMTLMGKALDKYAFTDGDSYVLSNNSGNVTINGNTTITANEDGNLAYAVDSCKYKTYEAPVVTIEGNVVINGNMELSGGAFNFNGGTFKGTLVYASGSATKADSVKVKTAEDFCWSEAGVLGAHEFVGATCTTLGTCAHCGKTGGELAPHNEVIDAAVAVTCTTNGLTEGKHCVDCGKITVVQQRIAKTGHDDVKVQVVKPTNTERGYTLYKCNHCGRTAQKDYVTAVYGAAVEFNGTYFKTLAEALAEARTSDAEEKEITFLRNIRGGVLEIDFDLIINFDGYYYTAEANDACAAIVNNAKNDAKLTLKNGILEVNFNDRKTFDTLIENNGNLNVENMTLKGSHLQKTQGADPSYIVRNEGDAVVTTSGEITVLTRDKYAVIGFEL